MTSPSTPGRQLRLRGALARGQRAVVASRAVGARRFFVPTLDPSEFKYRVGGLDWFGPLILVALVRIQELVAWVGLDLGLNR